jgi:hypothetical protein
LGIINKYFNDTIIDDSPHQWGLSSLWKRVLIQNDNPKQPSIKDYKNIINQDS